MLLGAWLADAPAHADTDLDALCPDADLTAYTTEPYASEKGVRRRCAILACLPGHGEMLPAALRERLNDELGKRFAVDLRFTGSVTLDGETIDYLMAHMPETAALVSAYSGNDYRATQMDTTPGPAGFFVTNNDTFAANFAYLSSRTTPDESDHVFIESGYAKVLFWRVWGNAIIHYNLDKKAAGRSDYTITVHVFTDSRVLRTVLNSGLFNYFAGDMFQSILTDIETGMQRFGDDASPEEKLPPYFIDDLKDTLPQSGDVETDLEQRPEGRPG